jgi:hypothetical protein
VWSTSSLFPFAQLVTDMHVRRDQGLISSQSVWGSLDARLGCRRPVPTPF